MVDGEKQALGEGGRQQPVATRSLFVCAGDMSADNHVAHVITRLQAMNAGLKVWGVGGPSMQKAGVELLHNCTNSAAIGPLNVLSQGPLLAKLGSTLLTAIAERKPTAVMLVDYGAFNLNLASAIKSRFPATPIIYFISPQVWGSRPWRINTIAATVSKMLVIFPFEEALYRTRGVNAIFVGHPLTEQLGGQQPIMDKSEFCRKYNLKEDQPLVGIFPGSRLGEIKSFMPILLTAVKWLTSERPHVQFVLSQANQTIADQIQEELFKSGLTSLAGDRLKLLGAEDNFSLMGAADILWTKSGTTTLEAALMEKPMLVFYRGDWLSYTLFLLFKRVKYVAWPNLLCGEMLVPELMQLDCRAEQLVKYTSDWLDVPGLRSEIASRLRQIKGQLGGGDFATNAALEVQKTLEATVV